MSKARGLFRNEANGLEYARVQYNPYDEVDLPRNEYETLGCEPPFDMLPTFAEYEVQDNPTAAFPLGPG